MINDDRTDDCACGADDVVLLRPKFKKGRFQMIDDNLGVISVMVANENMSSFHRKSCSSHD